MKNISLLISFIMISAEISAQQFLWSKQVGNYSAYADAHAIAIDAQGNKYITGTFKNNIDFDPGLGVHEMYTIGYDDVFVQKLDALGEFVWAKKIGHHANTVMYSAFKAHTILVDSIGSSYVVGEFSDIADFDPGIGEYILTPDLGGLFILKLDSQGQFSWVKQLDAHIANGGKHCAALNRKGEIMVTGYFIDTVDFDTGPASDQRISNGNDDVFVWKADSAGNFLWVATFGGETSDVGYAIDINGSGDCFLTGSFTGEIDLDPSPSVDMVVTPTNQLSGFIMKLDSVGNYYWSKQLIGAQGVHGSTIITDNNGDILVSGEFHGTVDFDLGPSVFDLSTGIFGLFVEKLDTDGNFIWVKKYDGQNTLEGTIDIDAQNNVYVSGFFNNTVDFDPGSAVINKTSVGWWDHFIQKLDLGGNFVWVTQVAGIGSAAAIARDIEVDDLGLIYTVGYFKGTVDFDPENTVNNSTANGGNDAFILCLSSATFVENISSKGPYVSLHPNPTTNTVYISSENNIDKLIITDILGKKIHESSPRTSTTSVSLPTQGIYFVTVSSGDKRTTQKLIVQ